MENEQIDVLVIGGGTAGSNAARSAVAAGATNVVMVYPPELINTCVEEGCMPSKSILAGAHRHEELPDILATRDTHVVRLLKALTDGFNEAGYRTIVGKAMIIDRETVNVTHGDTTTTFSTKSIVIATGSEPFVPPLPGLATIGDALMISDDVVSRKNHFTEAPKRLLTIGGGPIGLELSTFFHDMGSDVRVLQRGAALSLFDPEFGRERVRASQDALSFPLYLNSEVQSVEQTAEGIKCTINYDGTVQEEYYDRILIATGRRPRLQGFGLESLQLEFDERKNITVNEYLETSVPHIYAAGDVLGHHQILHFAAAMGKVAGHNAAQPAERRAMDYDKHMLAVSFDQFPSALIGLTETEATKRGIAVVTATRHFNSIGLGILKRQEYGLWKLVVEKASGKIIGSQILGPDSTGELIQVLTPIIANQNTVGDVLNMTWYHPTYAEVLQSLARDICKQDGIACPGM